MSASSATATVPSEIAPPTLPFRLEPWVSVRKDAKPVTPPDSLLEPWRVFVNQERPRQKKNPTWRSLPPRENVTLEMQPGSRFRCLVTPLEITASPDEDQEKVEGWVLLRRLRCSSNEWASWTEAQHSVVVADAKRTPTADHAELFLREALGGGKIRETTIFLRSDKKPEGKATTGPPRIVEPGPGVPKPEQAED